MTKKNSIFISACFTIYVISISDSAKVPRQNNSQRCTLPQHPTHGQWYISGSEETSSPGKNVSSGSIINVRCNGQYTLNGPSLIECTNGKWKSKIGKCLELCPPVASTPSTRVTCATNDKNNDCSKPRNGTVATFSCSPFYSNAELNRNPFRICINRKWNEEIPVCTPDCGIKPKKNKNQEAYYPWNAALYIKQNEEKFFICSGTLINERTILTAAHCITDRFAKKDSPLHYAIAVGKSFTKYHDDEDRDAQYSDVQDMFVPDAFRGRSRKYFANIAVIITKKSFNMTKRVQPVCVDWTNKYLTVFENPTKDVSIAGPLSREYYPFLKNITEISIDVIRDEECYDYIAPANLTDTDFQAFYTPSDMYCSKHINSDKVPKCLVDAGVGLVTKNEYDQKYYVIGVLHAAPSIHGSNCDNKKWTLYTRVSNYMSSLIIEKVNMYAPISRTYFQTSCGIKSVKAEPLIINGTNVSKGDYPWQAALYRVEGVQKELICGGSLINQRVILTAAHCVTDLEGNPLSTEMFAVVVGKYYRQFGDSRDTEAQFSSLKNIFVPSQYKGAHQNFLGDIAILVTENSFILTKQVHPICIDWDVKYESQFLKPSVNGYVTGWGFTKENQLPSEELKYLEVTYAERNQCASKLPNDYDVYLTSDKICSGFSNESKSVCNGDSGGGLVFKNNNDDRYYLAGIVSLSPQAPTGGCNSQQYALYTRVSHYVKQFIVEKVRLYWA